MERPLWAAAVRRIVRVRREVASKYVDVRAPCVWTIFENRRRRSSGAFRLELDDADAHEAHRPFALNTRDALRAAPVQYREPDSAATARIINECERVLGSSDTVLLRERVGLRPCRAGGVRVAAEKLRDDRTVIHNYGHGGAGFTLSWGCAQTVLELARGFL